MHVSLLVDKFKELQKDLSQGKLATFWALGHLIFAQERQMSL